MTEITEIPDVILALSGLLAVAALLAVVTSRLRVPLTLILVIVGFVAGELARSNGVELPIEDDAFTDVVLFVFLPVLVFEAALKLPARVFAKNLVPILALATVALAVTALLVGLIVHVGLAIPITAALLFGALIAATDPVAVTATFRELGVPNRLLVLLEGESLLNDGAAIVLFNILLVGALGMSEVGVAEGIGDFLYVFFGGAALGAVLGFGVAEVAARLGKLPSTALTVAVAYGAYMLGEEILGFSGVMASVAAGLVLSALSHTAIPTREVEVWHTVWDALGFVANGLLFLLIGLAINAELITDNLLEIAIAIGAVLIARPLAILPIMPLVTRLTGIPDVGFRNQAVLVWGGLRGGVALALALSIPSALPEQEKFIAMTAGVVLATLVVNATTLGWLVRYLGLDRPERVDRFVTVAARYDGAHAARTELHRVMANPDVEGRLIEVEEAAAVELAGLELTPEEHYQALLRRGIAVERQTLLRLVDGGLVPQWHARVALNGLEDQLDELALGRTPRRGLFAAKGLGALVYTIARRIHMGRLTPGRWVGVAYRDLNARLTATNDAIEAIEVVANCPGVNEEAVGRAAERFRAWHEQSATHLREFEATVPAELLRTAQRAYAADLGRLVSHNELHHLEELGLVSGVAVEEASELIADHLRRCERERLQIAVEEGEDVGV